MSRKLGADRSIAKFWDFLLSWERQDLVCYLFELFLIRCLFAYLLTRIITSDSHAYWVTTWIFMTGHLYHLNPPWDGFDFKFWWYCWHHTTSKWRFNTVCIYFITLRCWPKINLGDLFKNRGVYVGNRLAISN